MTRTVVKDLRLIFAFLLFVSIAPFIYLAAITGIIADSQQETFGLRMRGFFKVIVGRKLEDKQGRSDD